MPCNNYNKLSRTKLADYKTGAINLIGYKQDGTSFTLSSDESDLYDVDISDYIKLEASVVAAYGHVNFKFKLILKN